ncbi:MAG: TetR family transcriptional regulator [Candidatus Muproteobacteria bacterium RIFCSPHIGHO2_12_FULL_60_33]|uniref:TetR family transcriptional regulator n=1 Tax=Candidatus Muproteobacteria bacterium RIFCSPLOWO2_01_FULL_60_18 TaxID=1817768 RepID=A0A1F6TXZ7_9PROT|nr:MAG: TetR family transcriptional regulator [Candidatus Muproteobacteria bacterium RIFCSPHIGHO2_01_60_12]OGI50005.1 MAG: TetR family transcriptional regulator [Candidatus Muproteobacteria bacterium RIFCSPLOWO2_01_FULL_60_18]OGI54344.1 MAG: TetR family transcriptional regulator [Candidatus Muproteobacteria bacterium RIFCSPHIGHO2_12_FULL_60_33]OGI59326.1 MAG: TetR family transcriptional regulator [Candidatus Muproteobacteria bacterium RIFCSPHIGHO2_01_FULL_61_200]
MAAESARDKIIDAALELAGRQSWEGLRLHDVAAELQLSLNDVRAYFREKEDITDAWFDRADAAMLHAGTQPGLAELTPHESLHRLIMAWLVALAAHRRVTRQMIYGKFEPGHVHYQFAGLLRVSRTVQWLREAAHRDAVLPWRAFEETGLTAIYLATFFYWMRDESENATRTSVFLDRMLGRAERLTRCFPGVSEPHAKAGTPAPAAPEA